MVDERPDPAEMIMIHDVLRAGLTDGITLVPTVAVGDVGQAGRLAEHLELMLLVLHAHHDGEEQFLFPLLAERMADGGALVATLAGQHEQVLADLAATEAALGTWKATAARGDAIALEQALDALDAGLTAHLAQEEAQALPAVVELVSVEEFGRLRAHGLAAVPPEKMMIFLGHVLAQLPPAGREAFLAGLPGPAASLWATAGQDQYARYRADLGAV
jgi:hypothetical protein